MIIHPLISSHVYIYFLHSHSRSIYTYETCQAYQTAHYSWIMMFIYDAVSAFINVWLFSSAKMQMHINTQKVLGCISMRAKLSIIYISIIMATILVHNCNKKSLYIAFHLHPSYFLSFKRLNSNICITQLRQKSLYIALHLHRSYFLSSNRSEFARYFENDK